MKLIPGKTTIIAIGIVIAIIIGYFATSMAYDWDEGAPEANISCTIRAVGTGDSITGAVDIEQESKLAQMLETNPMTTFTSEIDTLDANTQYNISFSATMTTKTAKYGEALTNSISVEGKTGGSAAGARYRTSTEALSSSASVAGTAGSSSALSIPGFTKRNAPMPGEPPLVIMGDVIDGSVFTFTITSTAADGRNSTTTATLGITVTSGGKIYLTVNSITTTVAAELYTESNMIATWRS